MSSLIASLTLFIAREKDITLIKIMLYPRAVDAIYHLLIEKGIVKPIKHGQIYLYLLEYLILVYTYIYEPWSLKPSFVKQLDFYCDLNKYEK